jgi:hypothetical protein
MGFIRRIDELRRYADAVPRLAHAALKDVLNLEPVPDLRYVRFFAAKRKRGSARNHLQAGNLSQRIDNFFR